MRYNLFLKWNKVFAVLPFAVVFWACSDSDDIVGVDGISFGSEIESSSSQEIELSSSSSYNDVKSSSSIAQSNESRDDSKFSSNVSSDSESSSSSEIAALSSSVRTEAFTLDGLTKDSFKNPDVNYQTMTDERDGHVYRIVTIGKGDDALTWMAENLNFSENTTDSALAINLKSQTSCPLDKKENCDIAGRLYKWNAAMNINVAYKDSIRSAKNIIYPYNYQGVCPSGWHIPKKDEYVSLMKFVYDVDGYDHVSTALKSKTGWGSQAAGRDIFGFSFVPMDSSENGNLGFALVSDINDYDDGGVIMFRIMDIEPNPIFIVLGAENTSYVRCVKNKDFFDGWFEDERDGKKYKYARIGKKVWMAENLNYGKDSTGSCFWHDDEACSEYGRFYTYEEALNVCPENWHLPSKEEFQQLEEDVGGWDNAATYLRSTEWANVGNEAGLNTYGFNAKPTGYYGKEDVSKNGSLEKVFRSGGFNMWTSTRYNSQAAYMVQILDWSGSSISIPSENKIFEVPVRCVKN